MSGATTSTLRGSWTTTRRTAGGLASRQCGTGRRRCGTGKATGSAVGKTAGRIDPEIEGSTQRALASVPPLVAEAMRAFGIPALCCGKEKTTVVRAQFVAIYDQLAGREKRRALMPPALLRAIEGIGAGVD